MRSQGDARVRELVAEGRRMFRHFPLSDLELEILAQECLKAPVSVIECASDAALQAYDDTYEAIKRRAK